MGKIKIARVRTVSDAILRKLSPALDFGEQRILSPWQLVFLRAISAAKQPRVTFWKLFKLVGSVNVHFGVQNKPLAE